MSNSQATISTQLLIETRGVKFHTAVYTWFVMANDTRAFFLPKCLDFA